MPITHRSIGAGIASLLLILAFGCGQAGPTEALHGGDESSSVAKSAPANPPAPGPDTAKLKSMTQDYDETTPQKLSPVADREPDRYLIKNATLTLEARDVREVTDRVIAGAKRLKGYVSGLHETVDGLGTRTIAF